MAEKKEATTTNNVCFASTLSTLNEKPSRSEAEREREQKRKKQKNREFALMPPEIDLPALYSKTFQKMNRTDSPIGNCIVAFSFRCLYCLSFEHRTINEYDIGSRRLQWQTITISSITFTTYSSVYSCVYNNLI